MRMPHALLAHSASNSQLMKTMRPLGMHTRTVRSCQTDTCYDLRISTSLRTPDYDAPDGVQAPSTSPLRSRARLQLR